MVLNELRFVMVQPFWNALGPTKIRVNVGVGCEFSVKEPNTRAEVGL